MLLLEAGKHEVRARCGGEEALLDLRDGLQLDELLLERPWEPAPAEVPAVELLQEAGRLALAELPHRLAHEEDELCDDLLPRRLLVRVTDDLADRPRVALRGTTDHDRGRAGRRQHGLGSRREVTSPDAMTGTSTRSTSSAVSEWSASPVYICFADLGCSVSVAAPASTNRGPSSRQAREPFSRPRRIFTETGTETASATARTIAAARSGSPRRGTGASLGHLLDRAAEVDVDEVGTRGLDHPRRLGHRRRVAAKDLDRQRMLVGSDPEIAERALVAVLEPGAADHLRAHEPSPVPAPLAAKCLHAHTCHRGKDDACRDLDVADSPGCPQIYLHRAGKGSEMPVDVVLRRRYHARLPRRPFLGRAFFGSRRPLT